MNQALRNTVDAEIATLQPDIEQRQNDFKALRTDKRFSSGRFGSTEEVGIPTSSNVTIELNSYEYQPRGESNRKGHFTIYRYTDGDVTYKKIVSTGPVDMSHDWIEEDTLE